MCPIEFSLARSETREYDHRFRGITEPSVNSGRGHSEIARKSVLGVFVSRLFGLTHETPFSPD